MRIYKDEDRRIEHMENITNPSFTDMIKSALSCFICIFMIAMLAAGLSLIKRK